MWSPGFLKPLTPTRSHSRAPSAQNDVLHNPAMRRPGLAPLISSERNRSNSESVLQAMQGNRSKRMGMVTRKHTDLGVLSEDQQNRNSFHLRGQSHSSALRDRPNNGYQNSNNVSVGPVNTREISWQQGIFVRRLASVPEMISQSTSPGKFIRGTKVALYSLHLIYPQFSPMIGVMQGVATKRLSVEKDHNEVNLHLDHLDHELGFFTGATASLKDVKAPFVKNIVSAGHSALGGNQRVVDHLAHQSNLLARNTEPMYIRSLVRLLSGSLTEGSIAGSLLVSKKTDGIRKVTNSHQTLMQGQDFEEATAKPSAAYASSNQFRPNPERRWRNGSVVQQSRTQDFASPAATPVSAVPLYLNSRSRSNSRSNAAGSVFLGSGMNTPQSGEGFSPIGTPTLRSRSNSTVANNPPRSVPASAFSHENEMQFEKIYVMLTRTYKLALRVIADLVRSIDQLVGHHGIGVDGSWDEIKYYCDAGIRASHALRAHLDGLKPNDPTAQASREFWQASFDFGNQQLTLIRVIVIHTQKRQMAPPEFKEIVNPLRREIRNAFDIINKSPWKNVLSAEERSRVPYLSARDQRRYPQQTRADPSRPAGMEALFSTTGTDLSPSSSSNATLCCLGTRSCCHRPEHSS